MNNTLNEELMRIELLEIRVRKLLEFNIDSVICMQERVSEMESHVRRLEARLRFCYEPL